jgi:segregation and condensation protein B
MASREANQPGSDGLGLEEFSEPDDAGLSLDELSQAYAALLAKGTDPYAESLAEAADRAGGPLSPELHATSLSKADEEAFAVTPKSILEAMLFVGHPTGEPLTSERIAGLMRGVTPAEIDDLTAELNSEYAAAGAAYTIRSVDAGYRLELRPEFGPLRDVFHGRIRQARLSQAAIDCLAIVSYHQPIAAEQINRLRGKPSQAILTQLVRRDLLLLERPAGKKDSPLYRTTDRFLELFGLESRVTPQPGY